MDVGDVRYLFGYDRWATERVLAALDGVEPERWGAEGVVGERGLGSILVHMLGSHQRWRLMFQDREERPRPEEQPLPSPVELRKHWLDELDTWDRFVDGLTPEFLATVDEGVTVAVLLQHLANHGTQHRSEAALLLTQAGCSPGDLDLLDFADGVVAGTIPDPRAGRPG
jgi:uncharacterized damage-inducible protein DinB